MSDYIKWLPLYIVLWPYNLQNSGAMATVLSYLGATAKQNYSRHFKQLHFEQLLNICNCSNPFWIINPYIDILNIYNFQQLYFKQLYTHKANNCASFSLVSKVTKIQFRTIINLFIDSEQS